ncbi:hypothetical protein DPEC_G00078760 [Dallia pectoralis]|uniref:Uncharacterized protein n=1 Tax=Dallia pectoralis TaxID=75939 RepID=A0ACC2H4F8_DALPE|nr:hypothetical protein DPEC_G00078760 [Dallia pectoralis]
MKYDTGDLTLELCRRSEENRDLINLYLSNKLLYRLSLSNVRLNMGITEAPVKIWIVAVVMAGLSWAGTANGEKLVPCCERVSGDEVTDPITDYWLQKHQAPCVKAVVFQTENGQMCSYHKAPWVSRKIAAFKKAWVHRKIQQFE